MAGVDVHSVSGSGDGEIGVRMNIGSFSSHAIMHEDEPNYQPPAPPSPGQDPSTR